jgi:hypothetical protein
MNDAPQSGVPTAPNESLVCGEIVKTESGSHAETIWSLRVASAKSVPGVLNVAGRNVASTIRVIVPPGVEQSFQRGDMVEARVSYQGDEHGAAYFLIGPARHFPAPNCP